MKIKLLSAVQISWRTVYHFLTGGNKYFSNNKKNFEKSKKKNY